MNQTYQMTLNTIELTIKVTPNERAVVLDVNGIIYGGVTMGWDTNRDGYVVTAVNRDDQWFMSAAAAMVGLLITLDELTAADVQLHGILED